MQKTIFTILIILVGACCAKAVVIFNDGAQHIIAYVIDDAVLVDYDTPGMGTQVELISGGWIEWSLGAYEQSQITVWNGNIDGGIDAHGSSQVGIYGGTMESFVGYNYNVVEMTGGEIIEDFDTYDDSTAVVSGGIIGMGIDAHGNSEITLSGGVIGGNIGGLGHSKLNISGSEIDGSFYVWNESLITLSGSNFQVNGQPVAYGNFASDYAILGNDPWGNPCLTGNLTGILGDGSPLDNTFYIFDDADVTFVPEPATLFLMVLGGLISRNHLHKTGDYNIIVSTITTHKTSKGG